MAVVKAQVVIPRDSLLPEDVFVNTFYFESLVANAADLAATAMTALQTFYSAFDQVMAAEVSSPGNVKWFNMADSTPRVPILESPLVLVPNPAAGFPSEVAVCLSFQGPRLSGVPQARRRGRVFLGPWANTSANWDQTAAGITVSSSLRTLIANAASALAAIAGGDTYWSVYSPTIFDETNNLEASTTVVSDGWVDNAWDTIRSRGMAPSLRTVWT